MIPTNQLIALIISSIKEQQAAIAESAVLRPSTEAMVTGLTAGKYQGLAAALVIIDEVLREDVKQEKFS